MIRFNICKIVFSGTKFAKLSGTSIWWICPRKNFFEFVPDILGFHAINFPFDSWKARQTILCVSVWWWYDYIIRKKQCGQVSLRSHVVWCVVAYPWQGQLFFSHTKLPAAHTLAVSGCNTLLEHCVTLCHQRKHCTTQVCVHQLGKCAHWSASVTLNNTK